MAPHTPTPDTTTLRGFTKARYLTDDQINQILQNIEQGVRTDIACHEAGTSGVQFRRRRRRDPELTAKFEQIIKNGSAHTAT